MSNTTSLCKISLPTDGLPAVTIFNSRYYYYKYVFYSLRGDILQVWTMSYRINKETKKRFEIDDDLIFIGEL